jgi:hypothetical protein
MQFATWSLNTVVWYRWLMENRVSPDLTVYWIHPVGGLQEVVVFANVPVGVKVKGVFVVDRGVFVAVAC